MKVIRHFAPEFRLIQYFKDYERDHQNPINKRLHHLGIPLVMMSLLGLLEKIPLSNWFGLPAWVNLGLALLAAGAVFALRVDFKLALPFILYSFILYFFASGLPLSVLIGIQALGWFFQLFGHRVFEKKSPAFLRSLSHLFVGPLWIFAFWIGYHE